MSAANRQVSAGLAMQTWKVASYGGGAGPQPVNATASNYALLVAMHAEGSDARAALTLPSPCYPADLGAACARLVGWYVDAHGNAELAPDNVCATLLLQQQQLAAVQNQLSQQQLLINASSSIVGQLQAAADSARQAEAAARAAAEAAAIDVAAERRRCEEAAAAAAARAEASAAALAKSQAEARAAQDLLREAPRTRREQAAACGGGCCGGRCKSPFERTPAPPSPCEACEACEPEPPVSPAPSPAPSVVPAPEMAGWRELASEMSELREQLGAAQEAATVSTRKLKSAHAALAQREQSHDFIPASEMYAAFSERSDGTERSDGAAKRAAQRAVEQLLAALPEGTTQRAVVLDAALKRPELREAAAEAGIRTAGDVARAEEAMQQARSALGEIFHKRGPLSTADQSAVTTYLTFITQAADGSALQRGKQAKRQRREGGEVQPALVTGVREWAQALGLPVKTTWRQLKLAVERRLKLDAREEGIYWLCICRRRGHGLSDEVVQMVHHFYIAHPSIKRSPIKSDVLKIKDADGVLQDVPKLLSEISLTDVYLDFKAAHPDVKIGERAFRYLQPRELRRMKQRHLDMCGCRWCVEMRLMQEALNRARAELKRRDAAYTPPHEHERVSFAAAAAVCTMDPNAQNFALEATYLKCALGFCDKCGVNKMPTSPQEERTDDRAYLITYQRYEKVTVQTSYMEADGETRKTTEQLQLVKRTVPIGTFMQEYRKQLQYFTFHYHMSRWTHAMRSERAALQKGDLSLIMDYSEKLNKLRRTQVQSEHWVNTAMTIEVAVAEGFKSAFHADAQLVAALQALPPEQRGKALTDASALEKTIYYHCSDYKPQEAKVTTHNMEVMLQELKDAGVLKGGCIVYLKTDGCAKQYKCSKAMYLLCKLARDLDVTIDQMLEVTGHGKDEADGHGGVFKNWLTGEMMRADFETNDAPVIEGADQMDGEAVSFAEASVKRAREGLTDLKPASMNSKRRAASNTASRQFRTYTEADIRDAPEINPMTDSLARDAPANADSRVKATLGHNNYRADPELQRDGRMVIAVRRLACACDGCKRALERPIATRYTPHDTCARAASFGRLNDWKLVDLKPKTAESAELIEEDAELHLQARRRHPACARERTLSAMHARSQARTDGMLATIARDDNLAFAASAAPDGYYLARALGPAYETTTDLTLHDWLDDDGKPTHLPAGSRVVDAWFYEKADGTADWYYPYPQDDARGRVCVPSHMILGARFSMPAAVAPAPPRKRSTRWTASDMKRALVEKGAVVLPEKVEDTIRDEIDQRGA